MSQPVQLQVPVNAPHGGAGRGAAAKATTKASAYGGSELGSIIGNSVGPPIIGGIIGNVVGERVGEKAAVKTGINDAAGRISDDLAQVVGQRNVDKMGEITLTALGYSGEEECVCCTCLPASQVLLIVMSLFFAFNWYRLGVGTDYEWYCSSENSKSVTLEVRNEEIDGNSTLESLSVSSVDYQKNTTVFIVAYPCEFGFHYLVSGAAVWLAFLPFYLTQLLGNCWRQCCCCLCDPLVCFACCVDMIKRYLCECGSFNLISFIWHSMCTFQFFWALGALYWLVKTLYFGDDDYKIWDAQEIAMETTLASLILDLLLAGSELFHKVRLHKRKKTSPQTYEMTTQNPV